MKKAPRTRPESPVQGAPNSFLSRFSSRHPNGFSSQSSRALPQTLLALVLLFSVALSGAPALAAKNDPAYTLSPKGVVLQSVPDRDIAPQTELVPHPAIPGESPTTGQPLEGGPYLPMLVQIGNGPGDVQVKGRKVTAAGIGKRAPWGCQYADIVYESILMRAGQTRLCCLFSDSFAQGLPASVGPVRSARVSSMLLLQEWQGGLVYGGCCQLEEDALARLLAKEGTARRGAILNLYRPGYEDFRSRIRDMKAPDNHNVDLVGLRGLVHPTDAIAPRPFLFADESPYAVGYDAAQAIHLDWGRKEYVSHFEYDPASGFYLRSCGNAPSLSLLSAEERDAETATRLSFANVIIQRVSYEYLNDSPILPVLNAVGQGNADLFIAGRYIPGYWVRASLTEPTVFLDDRGNELRLARGKTFIAHFPTESLLCFEAAPL